MQSKRIGILPEFVPWGAPKGEVHRGGTAASPGHSPVERNAPTAEQLLRHVRDAMALTKKYGGVWQRWNDVRHYILALSRPQYYRDPTVKNGYMRGSETANYVDMIMRRWSQYRHALRTGGKAVSSVKSTTPLPSPPHTTDGLPHRRAAKKNKWRKE